MQKTSLILFDIGNILVKLTGTSIIQNNTKRIFTKEYVWEVWVSLGGARDFKTGKSNIKTFSEQVIDFYDLTLNPEQYLKLFRSVAECKFDGTDLFLKNISKEYELACLMNTNPIQ